MKAWPTRVRIAQRLKEPLEAGLLGTDHFGRDLLSLLMSGAWNSLAIAVPAVLLGAVLGTLVGFGNPRLPYGALAEKTVVPKGAYVPIAEGLDPAVAHQPSARDHHVAHVRRHRREHQCRVEVVDGLEARRREIDADEIRPPAGTERSDPVVEPEHPRAPLHRRISQPSLRG